MTAFHALSHVKIHLKIPKLYWIYLSYLQGVVSLGGVREIWSVNAERGRFTPE